MKPQTLAVALALVVNLAGCTRAEPRSKQYFDVHIDEAKKLVAGCRDGSVGGDECNNADLAVQEAEARDRAAAFFRVKRRQQ